MRLKVKPNKRLEFQTNFIYDTSKNTLKKICDNYDVKCIFWSFFHISVGECELQDFLMNALDYFGRYFFVNNVVVLYNMIV